MLNESHPIRATVTIIWKEKYKVLKTEFENKLRNNCEIYQDPQRKEVLKLLGIEGEFYDRYDLVGKIGTTSQFSYIIKERIDDDTRTSFDLFNNKEHIKEHVEFIRKTLRKTIWEHKGQIIIIKNRVYKWSEYFSINNINFNKIIFRAAMKDNLILLLGWFIAPITKIGCYYANTTNNLYNQNNDIVGATEYLVSKTTTTEIVVSLAVIALIFFVASLVEWRKKKHVIRL